MKNIKLKKIIFFVLSASIIFFFSNCKYTTKENTNKSAETSKPSIIFNEELHDFGVVKEGQHLEFSFQFTNKGSDTLKILDIKTRCGCTAAAPDKKEYISGEIGNIKVLFNTQGRHGKQDKDIQISTNDPDHPLKTLKITTMIE